MSVGQQATFSSIQAAGEIPTSARVLLLDTERQIITPSAYLEFTFRDGSTLIAVPVNQCNEGLGPVPFTGFGAPIELENGQLTFSMTVSALGFGDGCSIEIEMVVTTETPLSTPVPLTPVPNH